MLICGCAVGPDYQRPAYPVPDNFRGQGPGIPTQPAEASFGDLKWFEVFKDDKLQELIRIALKENYDVQIAAQRVLPGPGAGDHPAVFSLSHGERQ